jgi:hypothetical protein
MWRAFCLECKSQGVPWLYYMGIEFLISGFKNGQRKGKMHIDLTQNALEFVSKWPLHQSIGMWL